MTTMIYSQVTIGDKNTKLFSHGQSPLDSQSYPSYQISPETTKIKIIPLQIIETLKKID